MKKTIKDLTEYMQAVWNAVTLEDKQNAAIELVDVSRGSADTKKLAKLEIPNLSSNQLDTFAMNYNFKGLGMGVR